MTPTFPWTFPSCAKRFSLECVSAFRIWRRNISWSSVKERVNVSSVSYPCILIARALHEEFLAFDAQSAITSKIMETFSCHPEIGVVSGELMWALCVFGKFSRNVNEGTENMDYMKILLIDGKFCVGLCWSGLGKVVIANNWCGSSMNFDSFSRAVEWNTWWSGNERSDNISYMNTPNAIYCVY